MTVFKGVIFGSSKPSNDVPKSDSLSEFYTKMVEKAISKGFSKVEFVLNGDDTAVTNFDGLRFSNLPQELKHLAFNKFKNMTKP